uniref:Uncharacterized protein n=1 Tax=Leishmania guyanensis TaxID=5670 RepID=A0A1E1J1Z9_LEIGU|nr:Hypothetical protein BN36_3051080 [Leishmania guyanensis]
MHLHHSMLPAQQTPPPLAPSRTLSVARLVKRMRPTRIRLVPICAAHIRTREGGKNVKRPARRVSRFDDRSVGRLWGTARVYLRTCAL